MASDTARLRLLAEAAEPALAEIRRDQENAPPQVARMLSYLKGALFEPSLNVTTWKQALGIRDNSVAMSFHAAIGEPPKRYINRHRIATAARLLLSTRLKVWRVSELVGYGSLGVFSKAYRRTTGQRPNKYRRQHREPEAAQFSLFNEAERIDAMAGNLSPSRAAELIEAILSLYPTLTVEPSAPAPSATGYP